MQTRFCSGTRLVATSKAASNTRNALEPLRSPTTARVRVRPTMRQKTDPKRKSAREKLLYISKAAPEGFDHPSHRSNDV